MKSYQSIINNKMNLFKDNISQVKKKWHNIRIYMNKNIKNIKIWQKIQKNTYYKKNSKKKI